MLFGGGPAGELFRIKKSDGSFHTVTKSDINPNSQTQTAIQTDLQQKANQVFPVANEGWHFRVHVSVDQITDVKTVAVWGGPKDKQPEGNWW